MSNCTDLVKVRTVYGDYRFVSKADLENSKKILLPMYFATGRKLADAVIRQPGKPTSLHRENILCPADTPAAEIARLEAAYNEKLRLAYAGTL